MPHGVAQTKTKTKKKKEKKTDRETESPLLRLLRVGSTFPSCTDDSNEQQSDIIQEEDRPV